MGSGLQCSDLSTVVHPNDGLQDRLQGAYPWPVFLTFSNDDPPNEDPKTDFRVPYPEPALSEVEGLLLPRGIFKGGGAAIFSAS